METLRGYESRFVNNLQRRTFTIVRSSINDYKNYSRNFKKPFDYDIISSLREAIKSLCYKVQGLKFVYSYENEIIMIFTDFDKPTTKPWLNGNRDSITSLVTSILGNSFNKSMYELQIKNLLKDPVVSVETYIKYLNFADFKSSCFQIADRKDVLDIIIGAQESCISRCIKKYSENEPWFNKNLSLSELAEMLEDNEIYVEEIPAYEKWGSIMHTTDDFKMSECKDAINFKSQIDNLELWIP